MHAFLQKPSQIQRTSPNTKKPGIVGEVLRSHGRPLDKATQKNMDARFGFDFSRVRIHDGSQAAEAATALSARAYTVGRDIVFGAGQYSPGTHAGQRLIAHELTHVVQQLTATQEPAPALAFVPSHSPAEREADNVAGAMASGYPLPAISRSPGAWLQRSAISTNEHFLDLGNLPKLDMCEHLACNDVNACQDDANGIECPDGTKHAFKKTNHKFLRHLSCDPECNKASTPCDNSEQVIALPKGRQARKKCSQTLTICANGKSTTATVREMSEKNSWEVSGEVARALGVDPDFHGSIYPEANDPEMKDDRHCTPKPAPATPKAAPKKTEREKK